MLGRRQVLAVDDSAPLREMIFSVLAARGYRVTTAANGREAIDRLRESLEPQIVLVDIVMPVLDGLGLLAEVERDPSLRAAGHQFFLMSSTVRLSAPDIPPLARHLVKPFTRQELVAAVEAVAQASAVR